jgi:NAD(P)-dependent dehydrogenase (short-subunit alcohol dehydrogenase family)
VQSEALLEAGAKGNALFPRFHGNVLKPQTDAKCPAVYAVDRLEEPDPDFKRVQERAQELGTSLSFNRLDVRDNISLNATMARIADENGRIDGLLACAGVQQETPALDSTMEDTDRMVGVNISGTFMTAQAVARQMKRLEKPGSMVLIASMSGTIANKGLNCA